MRFIQNNNYLVLGLISILFFFSLTNSSFALKLKEVNQLASVKASIANIRSGPGINYPVKFTYNMRHIPVRVISEYDNWREIEDFEGDRGWINQNLLSGKKTIIVQTKQEYAILYSSPTNKSRIISKLENKVVAKLVGCKKSWCKVEVKGDRGWLKQKDIWPN